MAIYNGGWGVIVIKIDVDVIMLYIASLSVSTRNCPQSETTIHSLHSPADAMAHLIISSERQSCPS